MSETASTIDANETLESTTLASRTFDSIKADIIDGELAQGTTIVESDLAPKYGISRGPLREAIHRLDQIKLNPIKSNQTRQNQIRLNQARRNLTRPK